MRVRRPASFLVPALLLASCSTSLDGPVPAPPSSPPAVAPAAVCVEQLATWVTVLGGGMSPLPTGLLEDEPELVLPFVELVRELDLDENAVAGSVLRVPDSPDVPGLDRVRWVSQEEMRFEVYPELALQTGLHTIRVTNGNGHAGEWPRALLAVPRPRATAITPDLLCADADAQFKLTGDFFIRAGDALPRVVATAAGAEPITLAVAAMDGCRALPGDSGTEACTEITVDLPRGTLAAGATFQGYDVVVQNPDPTGCQSTEALVLTMVPAPTLTVVEPALVCTAQADTVLAITGTGFLTVDGVTPSLAVGPEVYATTVADCEAITGPHATVQRCATLTATIPRGELPPGTYDVSVRNPAPADCVASNSLALTVVPPPRVDAAVPDLACLAQADVAVTIQGSGFLVIDDGSGGRSVPTVGLGDVELVPAPSGCAVVAGTGGLVEACTTLQVTVPQGALAPGSWPVRVTNPATAACHSEEDVTFTVVAPPAVTDVTPDVVCVASSGGAVTITGTGFLTVGGTPPAVLLDGAPLTVTAAGCSPVPGPTETVQACTTLTATIPTRTTAALVTLLVTNPLPAGCSSAAANVYVTPPPQLVGAAPSAICSTASSTALALEGTDLLVVAGQEPTLTIGAGSFPATATGCRAVLGLKETLQVCTGLTTTVPQGSLGAGANAVIATNPPPASCASDGSLTLAVVAPPTLTGVSPNKLCVGGGSLNVTGTGFRAGAQVRLAGVEAASVVVSSGTQLTATFSALGLGVGGPYALSVTNDDGCGATLDAAVTVTAGPQLFFADPPVVYNGIGTTISLYGSGFTGTIAGIAIRPTGSATAPTALGFTYDAGKANRVQAVVPDGTAAGDYDVLLSDQSTCSAVLVGGLKVVDTVTLELTAIVPPFGGTSETTAVTVQADPAVGGGFQAVPRLYLSPQGAAQAEALGSVAFLDSGRVTAVVPKGMALDTYDLIAVNPDGGVGVLLAAFTVTDLPPPMITGISPGSIPNQTGQAVKITGTNFRSPTVVLRCLDVSTATQVEIEPPITNPSVTELTVTVDASSYSMGAICVVRVVAGDNQTYGDFSSLVITNLAQNLTAFRAGPPMATPRRALAAVSNQATPAARFVYALGGDGGSTDSPLASVEVAPVDVFGQPGAFFTQGNGLGTARSFAGAAAVGRCLYLVGGINDTVLLSSVERACVLDPEERPEITDLDLFVVPSAGLDAGLWYYQVAALLPPSHALNPGGETLPSEPFPVLLPTLEGQQIAVTVHWSVIAGATGYRVYRSPSANAGAHELQLLAEVGGAVTSFADTGLAVGAGRPQRLGATGVWHPVASALATARQGPGVTIAPDPGDATGTLYTLYVAGGKTGANQAATSCERLAITLNGDGSQSVGSFTACGQELGAARWQLALFGVGNDNAALVTPPTRYLYAGGGVAANGATMVPDVEVFEILAGGALAAPAAVDDMQPFRAGYGFAAVNNFLFAFGGTQGTPNDTASSIKLCAGPSGGQCPSGPPALENWNNVSGHLTVPRYLMGSAIQSGFIYLLGGQTDVDPATSSTEYTIW